MYMEQFTFPLLQWYQENARDLPWRNNPNPYHVWLSEIMLQQTRVVAVLDYYARFLQELPTIPDLAQCDEDKLMKLWEGLGYYNRARNLQKAAKQIMEDFQGVFPENYQDILNLSGIGEYTAGAIASSVYSLPHPAVDGNVLRVITRFTAHYGDITTSSTKKEVSQWVMDQMPLDHVTAYNQALMELGATVCLPNGAPLCETCPVSAHCSSEPEGKWRELPVKKSKKPRKLEERQVFLVYKESRIAIRQRPQKGLLAGLWEFPHDLECHNPWDSWGIHEESTFLGTGTHIFSHIEWNLRIFSSTLTQDDTNYPKDWIFVTKEELREKYAVPSAFSSVFDHL